jgi:hypothetical protein
MVMNIARWIKRTASFPIVFGLLSLATIVYSLLRYYVF